MREKSFLWWIAPGFTVINATNAFRDHGVHALQVHPDEISTRQRKGWKAVRIELMVYRPEAWK